MNEEVYIDFDGVIVDTQTKIDYYFSLFDNKITPEWNKFLANINWKMDVLSSAKEINNAFEILRELYKIKKNIYILSRVFSLSEYKDKLLYLRDNGIYINVIPSPGRIEKSRVVIPSQDRVLIDDSKSNIKNWIDNDGRGVYFSQNLLDIENAKKYFPECVSDLKFLLKKKQKI